MGNPFKKAKRSFRKSVETIKQVVKKPSLVLEDPKAALGVYGSIASGGTFGATPAFGAARAAAGDTPAADLEGSSGAPPTSADTEVQAAAREQRKRYGRAATLLTGGRGLLDQAPTVRRTLLGA